MEGSAGPNGGNGQDTKAPAPARQANSQPDPSKGPTIAIGDRLRALGLETLGENPSPDAREAVLRRWAVSLDGADPLREELESNELAKILPASEV